MTAKELLTELEYIIETYGEDVELTTDDDKEIEIDTTLKRTKYERPVIVIED